MTPEEFRKAGHRLVDWIADYRERLARGEFPVRAPVVPGDLIARLPKAAPEQPESFEAVMYDLEMLIRPAMTHWQHPRFFAYFPTGGTLSSVLADMVSTGFASIGLNWESSPALTELEQVTTDWVRDLLGLSRAFSGVIQDTASAASFVALVCARERASEYGAAGPGMQGAGAPLIVYTSVQAHSSVEKAALLAGFGRQHVRALESDEQFRLKVSALERAIENDRAEGFRPCAVVATSGTTATTAFDPIGPIAEIAQRHGLWLHVDGAMGGAAMLLPEFRHHWQGIEHADSIVVNPHKWMSVAFDCSVYFVRDPQHLTRVMSTNPSYLRTAVDEQVRNYRDWGIPLGRRFRALKLWMALRDQGAERLRQRMRRDLDNAQWLATQVRAAPDWRCVAPVTLQTVCVRHEPAGLDATALDAHTRRWAEHVNASGRVYVTPAMIAGRWMVRLSIGSELTEREHVGELWATLQQAAAASARTVRAPG